MRFSRIVLRLDFGTYRTSWVQASPEGDENNRQLIKAVSEMGDDYVLEFEDFDTDVGFFDFFSVAASEIISISEESMEA